MKKNPHTNRFNSIKGAISDRELQNFLLKKRTGAAVTPSELKRLNSDRELQWLKKRTGSAVTLSELKRLKKLIPNN